MQAFVLVSREFTASAFIPTQAHSLTVLYVKHTLSILCSYLHIRLAQYRAHIKIYDLTDVSLEEIIID